MKVTKPTQQATHPTPAQAVPTTPRQLSVGELMRSPSVSTKIKDILGSEKVAAGFISSVISVANGNKALRSANPMTVVGAAMVAATLQLPVVPTIGLAYIVPYKGQAQFQIGYKGLIELAERSGQFKNIIDEVVYEGQLIRKNKFTGEYIFDEDAKKSDKVVGYMARFDLINGFSKTIYWSIEEVEAHAKRFSQAFRSKGDSPWKSDFDAMARKTVLKSLFSKYAPKSIQMQNAITYDQATIKANDSVSMAGEPINIDAFDVEYIDNPTETTSEEIASEAKHAAMAKLAKVAAALETAIDEQPSAENSEVDLETGEVTTDK
ncbi:MAG: recombinase RecT [Lepagella sp.]